MRVATVNVKSINMAEDVTLWTLAFTVRRRDRREKTTQAIIAFKK